MFIMQVGGKVESIFNSYALHPVQATWVLKFVFAVLVSVVWFSANVTVAFAVVSSELWTLRGARGKKKFNTSPPWLQPQRNLGWETSLFSPVFLLINSVPVITAHSSCSAYDFLVCVTVASKTCEQEDGEISWSPSPSIKMAECLVMLGLH